MQGRTLFKAAIAAASFAMPAMPAMASAQTGDRPRTDRNRARPDLFIRDWGEGPVLLFLHGWGLASDSWNYVMAPLVEQGFRCVSYDRRGHGRSGDPGGGYDYDTLADDLAHVIETLGLRDVTLVGHSMASGEMARYMTRHRGAGVARLAFVAPASTPFLLKTGDNPGGLDEALFAANRAQMLRDFPEWLRANLPPFFVPGTSQGIRDWGLRMMEATSLHALIECNKAMTQTDFRADLARIDRPTIVVHGTADASVPLEFTGRPTADAIPGARLIVYEGAPHGIIMTHAERLVRDIAVFARQR